jgi:hypothetical protein
MRVPKMAKNGFYSSSQIQRRFRSKACPYPQPQAALSRNMKSELKPFLTNFGTGMRA